MNLWALIATTWLTASVLGGFVIGHWMSGRDL